MRTFAQKQNPSYKAKSATSSRPTRALSGQKRDTRTILHLQRGIENHAVQRLLLANVSDNETDSTTTTSTRFAHDFSRIPVFTPSLLQGQPKLADNIRRKVYDWEADLTAAKVIRMLKIQVTQPAAREMSSDFRDTQAGWSVNYNHDKYEHEADQAAKEVLKNLPNSGFTHTAVDSSSTTTTLPSSIRHTLEQSFVRDLSNVRVHTDSATAKQVASAGARALTLGPDIAFAPGQYAPETRSGIGLLAHEIAHVVQQGYAPIPSNHSYQSYPALSRRPSAIRTAQPTLEIDPARFTGANASQLGMNLVQFKRHIESELHAVTGLRVTFSGNQLVLTGSTAASSTAVRVLRLAINAPPPPY